jgi:hypothetical protein
MANTLSKKQMIVLCKIMGTPYKSEMVTVDGTGRYAAVSNINASPDVNAKMVLVSILDSFDTEEENDLKESINEYISIRFDTSTMTDTTDGVKYDPELKRKEIENDIRNMCNYQRIQDVLNGGNSTNTPVIPVTIYRNR